jgi:hypothetical protein
MPQSPTSNRLKLLTRTHGGVNQSLLLERRRIENAVFCGKGIWQALRKLPISLSGNWPSQG